MGKTQKKREEQEEEVRPSKRTCTNKPPLIILAHGAGASSNSEWMLTWKDLLFSATGAVDVVTFDYPYCAGGKKGAPPKAEKLIIPHTEEIRKEQLKYPGHPLVLAGKSMGSRVSCMVAGQGTLDVSAIVCLGYPLKGTSGALRDETLLELRVPVMFVQGSKDGLCPLDKLQGVLKKMVCSTKLHVIEGGDHSFKSIEQVACNVVDHLIKGLGQWLGAIFEKDQVLRICSCERTSYGQAAKVEDYLYRFKRLWDRWFLIRNMLSDFATQLRDARPQHLTPPLRSLGCFKSRGVDARVGNASVSTSAQLQTAVTVGYPS
ncbi:hypothetical protein GOP47_0005334 [Adiantum capillus-veneris]|uniref:KANL3/Tex30 alpha/beta hydrolase-like domain-containing protein n=1 Tax=Adiantum capillus-veneris TaxID=13818 RepID=A0A9D4ZP14_ADICA|nr:hypothetical protein GOP47_0005334 [Adiantum capillus-veneris]